jgi:hypothetical protein
VREAAGDHVEPGEAELAVCAPPGVAQDAEPLAVVDHHQRAVPLGQAVELGQLRGAAREGEHALGHQHAEPRGPGALEQILQVPEILVPVDVDARARQLEPVGEAGRDLLVREDVVALGEQGLEEPQVGVVAAAVDQRLLGVEEVGDGLLELEVEGRGPDERPRPRRAHAPALDRLGRRLLHVGVMAEAEVVAGGQVEERALADRERRPGERAALELVAHQPRVLEVLELEGEVIEERATHAPSPPGPGPGRPGSR